MSWKWIRTIDNVPDNNRDVLVMTGRFSGGSMGFYDGKQWKSREGDQHGFFGLVTPLCWCDIEPPDMGFLRSCEPPRLSDQINDDARALNAKLAEQGIDPNQWRLFTDGDSSELQPRDTGDGSPGAEGLA